MAITARRPWCRQAGRFERFGDFLLIGARVHQRLGLAPAPGQHQQETFDEQEDDEQQKHPDAERPQPLRNPQRRAQHADVGRAEQERLIDEVVGALGDEAHEHRERREAQQVHRNSAAGPAGD